MSYKKYFTDQERKEARRAVQAKYRSTPEYKAKKRADDAVRKATPEYKAKQRAYDAARRATPEGKAKIRAYNAAREADPEARAKQRKAKAAYDKTTRGLCTRIKNAWGGYGIKFASNFDREIWLALALYDGTVCAVTGMTNAEHQAKYGCRLVLDHDHQTGEPRRFLARHLNLALGAIEGLTPEQITNLLRLYEEDRRTRDDLA